MNGQRLALIRRKNTAFAALCRAEVLCCQRRKRGPLPTSWLARLAELEAQYQRAVLEMTRYVRE
ncbi:MAG: hypothetical protein SWK90_11420 [Chloroflexota bacterium]|nr:hypothetical protein [Chloroflexota bacterium]